MKSEIMSDELDKLSDQELSSVFAVEVEGWRIDAERELWISPQGNEHSDILCPCRPFATDANAVLPLLEMHSVMVEHVCYESWSVTLDPSDAPDDYSDHTEFVTAPTLARAVCIALIRARRAGK